MQIGPLSPNVLWRCEKGLLYSSVKMHQHLRSESHSETEDGQHLTFPQCSAKVARSGWMRHAGMTYYRGRKSPGCTFRHLLCLSPPEQKRDGKWGQRSVCSSPFNQLLYKAFTQKKAKISTLIICPVGFHHQNTPSSGWSTLKLFLNLAAAGIAPSFKAELTQGLK